MVIDNGVVKYAEKEPGRDVTVSCDLCEHTGCAVYGLEVLTDMSITGIWRACCDCKALREAYWAGSFRTSQITPSDVSYLRSYHCIDYRRIQYLAIADDVKTREICLAVIPSAVDSSRPRVVTSHRSLLLEFEWLRKLHS